MFIVINYRVVFIDTIKTFYKAEQGVTFILKDGSIFHEYSNKKLKADRVKDAQRMFNKYVKVLVNAGYVQIK